MGGCARTPVIAERAYITCRCLGYGYERRTQLVEVHRSSGYGYESRTELQKFFVEYLGKDPGYGVVRLCPTEHNLGMVQSAWLAYVLLPYLVPGTATPASTCGRVAYDVLSVSQTCEEHKHCCCGTARVSRTKYYSKYTILS